MNKVRVVMAEMEGTDEALLAAIRSFLPETRQIAPPAVVVQSAPKAIAAPAEIQARVPVKRTAPRRTKAAQEDEGGAPKVTLSGAIRAAVREGPKTNGEVVRYLLDHGFPDASSSTVSTILCQRRKANEIYKDDDDLKWHIAEKRV